MKTFKTLTGIVVSFALLASPIADGVLNRDETGKYVSMQTVHAAENRIRVTINGKEISFDQEPIMINNRVMVPVRKIFEELGAKVTYLSEPPTVLAINKDNKVIRHEIGETTALFDGQIIEFDEPSVLVNDRTLVPIRFAAILMNAEIEWIPDSNEVRINTVNSIGQNECAYDQDKLNQLQRFLNEENSVNNPTNYRNVIAELRMNFEQVFDLLSRNIIYGERNVIDKNQIVNIAQLINDSDESRMISECFYRWIYDAIDSSNRYANNYNLNCVDTSSLYDMSLHNKAKEDYINFLDIMGTYALVQSQSRPSVALACKIMSYAAISSECNKDSGLVWVGTKDGGSIYGVNTDRYWQYENMTKNAPRIDFNENDDIDYVRDYLQRTSWPSNHRYDTFLTDGAYPLILTRNSIRELERLYLDNYGYGHDCYECGVNKYDDPRYIPSCNNPSYDGYDLTEIQPDDSFVKRYECNY